MDSKTINSISKTVYRRFPEVVNVKPSVRKQSIPGSKSRKPSDQDKHNFLLTYKANVKGPNGQKISRLVRVVATASGKIIKTTTSK